MKHFILLLCGFLSGCTGVSTNFQETKPPGDLLVSIRMTESAFNGRPKKKSGYFFYVENPTLAVGPVLTGYEIRNGETTDLFGGASESADVIKAFEAIDFEPFDFHAEVKLMEEHHHRKSEDNGELTMTPFALDGAEYEIVIITTKGRFALKEWNPGVAIDFYAPQSKNIAKLKAVLDLLATYYGRLKFGA